MTGSTAFIGLDIETTGLDPYRYVILEIGIVSFNEAFEPLKARSWIVAPKYHVDNLISDVEPEVREMHEVSGLLRDVKESNVDPDGRADIADEITAFIESESHGQRLPMVGSSVSFDRTFLTMDRYYRRILDVFCHRSVDARSIFLAHMSFVDSAQRAEVHQKIAERQNCLRNEFFRTLPHNIPRVSHRPVFDLLGSASLIRAVYEQRVQELVGSTGVPDRWRAHTELTALALRLESIKDSRAKIVLNARDVLAEFLPEPVVRT